MKFKLKSTHLTCLFLLIIVIGLAYISMTKEGLDKSASIPITPPNVVIQDYLKHINKWDDVDDSTGYKAIQFQGGGCGLSKNGPWGYRYSVKFKNDDTQYYFCVPPHTATKRDFKKCDDKKESCYKYVPTKLPFFPNGAISPDRSPVPAPGTTKVKIKPKPVKKKIDPYSIFSGDSGSPIPRSPISHPGFKWTWPAPDGSDFDELCTEQYGPNYGVQMIPKFSLITPPGQSQGLCSRAYRNKMSLYEPTSTPCMPWSPGGDVKAQLAEMDKVCKLLYPKTFVRDVNPAPCPQPGQARGVCEFSY
jgi:hypothetical protein